MCRFLFMVMLTVWAGVLIPAQEAPDSGPTGIRRLADGLYARGLYGLALEEYEKLISQTPPPAGLAVILYRAGESARQEGEMERAIALYRRVLERPDAGEAGTRARLRLADHAYREKRLEEAAGHLDTLLASKPDAALAAPALYLRGRVYEAAGNITDAVQTYQTLSRTYNEDPMAGYAALRLAALRPEDTEQTLEAYRKVLENPASQDMEVEALWGLAQMAARKGEDEEAAMRYWTLWQRHPDNARVRGGMLYIAWAQLQAGKFANALTLAKETSPERKQDAADTWMYLEAVAHLKQDNIEQARRRFESLRSSYPRSRFFAMAGYELAVLQYAAGEHAGVLGYAEDLLSLPSRKPEALWMLAESARAVERSGLAIQYYTRLVREVDPQHPRIADARYTRAMLMRSIDGDRAADSLIEFARRHPKDVRAPTALKTAGLVLITREAYERALVPWKQALDTYPEAEGMDMLRFRTAMLEIRSGEGDVPAERLGAALEGTLTKPARAEALYWLGVLKDRKGDADEAGHRLKTAIEDPALNPELRLRARLRMGKILHADNKYEEALKVMVPVLSSDKADEITGATLLWMLETATAQKNQVVAYDIGGVMARENRPDELRELGFYAMAASLAAREKPQEAVKAWKKGLAMQSESEDAAIAAYRAGITLLKLGRADEAGTWFGLTERLAAGLERDRLRARAMMGRGDAHTAAGKHGPAARLYMGVGILFEDPEITPAALKKAAESFKRAGEADKAVQALSELKNRYPDA